MIGLTLITALCGRAVVWGEVTKSPDAHTLWVANGVDEKTGQGSSDKHWADGLDLKTGAGGSLVFCSTADPKRYATGRYFPVDPAYPYIVFEITDVQKKEGYRGFQLQAQFPNAVSIGMVSHLQTGVFAYPILRGLKESEGMPANAKQCWFRIDLHNSDVTIPCIKLMKEPENYISISSPAFEQKKKLEPGDDVTFTVKLKDSAEDVTLSFFDSYTMPQLKFNGEQKLQLKPTGDDQKVWMATVKAQSIGGGALKPGEQFKSGRMLIKATLLGGAVKTPLWTTNMYEFAVRK